MYKILIHNNLTRQSFWVSSHFTSCYIILASYNTLLRYTIHIHGALMFNVVLNAGAQRLRRLYCDVTWVSHRLISPAATNHQQL